MDMYTEERSLLRRALPLLLLIAAAFAALLVPRGASADALAYCDYVERVYDAENGLLTSEANDVLQTRDGYIWIASYSGLTRYDSISFKNYGAKDELLAGCSIRCLFEDSRGRLWIGSNDNGVFIYENGAFRSLADRLTMISGSIRAFCEDANGNIYVASTGGLAVLDGELNARKAQLGGMTGDSVSNLLCDRNGAIWGVTIKGSVFCVYRNMLQFYLESGELNSFEGTSLYEAKDGSILIGTYGSEVISLSHNGYAYDSLRLTRFEVSPCETVNCFYTDSRGNIWLGSDAGIGYFDGSMSFTSSSAITGATFVERIFEDYEGNLWLASSRGGVYQLVRGKFTNTGYSSGMTGVTVNATELYGGELWCATDNGLCVLDTQTFQQKENALTELLRGVRVRGVFADSKGNMWVTTYKTYGVIRYRDGKYISITPAQGLTSEKTRVAIERRNGDIVVATGGGVSIIRNDAVIKTYTEADGLANPVILCLYEAADGSLCFGSDGGGIYVVPPDEGRLRTYTETDGLSSGVILNMVYDGAAGGLWISTGAELNFWDAEGIRRIANVPNRIGSLFDVKCFENEVWFIRSTSLVIANRSELLADAEGMSAAVLDRTSGLCTDITSNSRHYVSPSGSIWLATGDGVYRIDAGNMYENRTPVKLAVNSVSADGVELSATGALTVPADTKRLTIDFVPLCFSSGECTLYYKLEGFDDEETLITSGKLHAVDYTNLSGGSYAFTARAISPAGIPGENELRVPIKKELSFFEHLGVRISCFALLLALVVLCCWLVMRYRTRRLLERQAEYKRITDQALRTVAHTIDAKDRYTIGHSRRVAAYSREIARRLGLNEEDVEQIYYIALLHDIGKIGIPDSVLKKPSKLTDEEYEIIRSHPTIGGEILKDFNAIPHIAEGAKYHHERYDGKGYNAGLKGDAIPLCARIIGVADAYDAMSSERVYRPAIAREIIENELRRCSGTQFDAKLAEIMADIVEDGFNADIGSENEP